MTEINEVTQNPDEVLAYIVKREDGYHVVDHDGTEGPVCYRCTTDGYLILTPNAANRKNINKRNIDKFFEEHPDGRIELTYKDTRKLNSYGPKMPNAKLISYLSEEEQEEYKAIIARAIAARDADKKKPLSPIEKAQLAAQKAQAKYEALLAEANQGGND